VNEIFSYFIPRKSDDKDNAKRRLAYASWFVESFPETEFNKEERIMWFFLNYAVKLGVPLKERYLTTFMDAELKPLLVKSRIKVTGTEMLSMDDISQMETAVQITKDVMKQEYYALTTMETDDIDEFLASADAFMAKQLNERLVDLYQNGFTMMNSLQNNSIGPQDALEFTQVESQKIADIYDREKLEELNSNHTGEDDEAAFQFVYDFGIPTVDKDTRGVFTTQLIGYEAAPGKGKTRFALGVAAYRAAVVHKRNVSIWSLEQTEPEIKAMLVARHMFQLFNIQVDDKMILTKTLPAEAKAKYEAAKIDLFESGRYGKLDIVCDSLYLHSFIDRFKMRDTLHGPFDVIIIDYMALIEQVQEKGQWRIDDNRVTAAAYKRFKRYLRKSRKTGLAINQYNAEGTKLANEDKEPGATGSAGGMEASRSVDYMLSMTSTTEMEAQRKRRLSATKKRGTEGFGSVLVDVRLGFCYFYQQTNNIL
jgi:hypothetical protein